MSCPTHSSCSLEAHPIDIPVFRVCLAAAGRDGRRRTRISVEKGPPPGGRRQTGDAVKDVLDDRDQRQSAGCRVVQPDDVDARTAKKTAVSISAAITSPRGEAKSPSPRDGEGPIHRFAS
jgi:hypothetical protein